MNFAVLLLLTPSAPLRPEAIEGDWLTAKSAAVVRIRRQGNRFDGTLVWIRDSLDAQGKLRLDAENPDPALRGRRLAGLGLLQ
ncbi:MAG TPA: DUF2147 domain-containing protein, partial [Myxococcota bacterium]|nr:DUF2147 domain-containing protein [Myxococcota bacterium]